MGRREAERSSLRGKNSAAPEPEAKPRRLPEALRAVPNKNIFFSLSEKNWGWRAKSENAKKMFLLGTRALRAAAGRSGWFRSAILDKMSSSRVVKTHQNLTFGKLTDFFVGGTKCRPRIGFKKAVQFCLGAVFLN